jgi:hypothetical protein
MCLRKSESVPLNKTEFELTNVLVVSPQNSLFFCFLHYRRQSDLTQLRYFVKRRPEVDAET